MKTEKMAIVCDIFMMWDKIGFMYNRDKQLKELLKLSFDELFEKQSAVIEVYNHHMQK